MPLSIDPCLSRFDISRRAFLSSSLAAGRSWPRLEVPSAAHTRSATASAPLLYARACCSLRRHGEGGASDRRGSAASDGGPPGTGVADDPPGAETPWSGRRTALTGKRGRNRTQQASCHAWMPGLGAPTQTRLLAGTHPLCNPSWADSSMLCMMGKGEPTTA